MDKLKGGSSSFRQALTLGDAGVLEDWAVCSCLCSQLPGAEHGWGSQGERAALSAVRRKRRIRVSLPLRKVFDLFPQVRCLTLFCLPCAGCPREQQWEAVELASAAGEAGLPVSLC